MGFKRFFWRLFVGNAVLVAAVLGMCLWAVLGEFERFHGEEVVRYLKAQASALRPVVSGKLNAHHAAEFDRLAKDVGALELDGFRLTFVAADGTVLGDSDADPAEMESHADRAEIRQALHDGWGQSMRLSSTVSRELRYVAVRVGPAQDPEGVIRTAIAVRSLGAHAQSARRLVWMIGLVSLIGALLLGLGLSWLWSGRISRITKVARSLSRGDLSARLELSGRDEVTALARSLNRMREHLAEQLDTIDGQRRSLEALLAQVHDGVIVADPAGRIALLNPAAEKLLAVLTGPAGNGRSFLGTTVDECVDQPELKRMLGPQGGNGAASGRPFETASPEVFAGTDVYETRIDVERGDEAVHLLARASDILLPDFDKTEDEAGRAGKKRVGRVVVLTDVTELTRTIQMKTDFVANASHELRTPLSAIRAAIETLMNMPPAGDPASTRRFLEVADRHSTRLEALVADLLALSGVESSATRFDPETLEIAKVCEELQSRWAHRLKAKRINWRVAAPKDCRDVFVNAHLLQLVLNNLVENAIKFTEEGGRVEVSWQRSDGAVTVEVADNGCGIGPEEQTRVFERFYRIEQARSGRGPSTMALRGTGLGLSIVKHAVANMGGIVKLQSELGQGTRVRVTIPQPV